MGKALDGQSLVVNLEGAWGAAPDELLAEGGDLIPRGAGHLLIDRAPRHKRLLARLLHVNKS